jgi:putative membrane protein
VILSCVGGLAKAAEIPAADVSFAKAAAAGGIAEVHAAQVAEKKAAAPGVKEFAQQMDKDHTLANSQLIEIAKAEGITLPAEPDMAHKATLEQLSKLSNGAFDRQYMQGQVSDHRATVALFQQEAGSGQDPQLKAFAQKQLPILQHHLQMAEGIKTEN